MKKLLENLSIGDIIVMISALWFYCLVIALPFFF